MESNAITVKSSRIFATRLMLFCAGNAVDDDITVNIIFLVNLVCSLRSANVIHRQNFSIVEMDNKLLIARVVYKTKL